MIQKLTIEQINHVAFYLARKHPTLNEPIPDFETRYPGKSESCIEIPFQTAGQKLCYRGFIPKACILFYKLVKNHPFQNGNKRIAVTTLLYFLYKNGKWLDADNDLMLSIAVKVAASLPAEGDKILESLNRFFKAYIIDYPYNNDN